MRYAPLLIALLLVPLAIADLDLDSIQYDPPIIVSGDEVDIIIQFHHTAQATQDPKIGNPAYTFKVTLTPDDTLTRQYVRVEDAEGDEQQGIITRGGQYNRKFRVRVLGDAPAGNYEFKLTGQWYKDGIPQEGQQYLRFTMPVKRQGIAIGIANIVTEPAQVRSGDKRILLTTALVNTGEKTAKNVRIALAYPEGISSAYTNDNQLYVGVLNPSSEEDLQFYVDTERFLPEGAYKIGYTVTYQDLDDNTYETGGTFPFVIKRKPDIVVTKTEGDARAGESATLTVTVQNKGEETAEAVDIRILKQASQPFAMDVRSDYIGQLRPGETGTAVFTLDVNRDAEVKEHQLTVLIRAKGDSEEGDDTVYTTTDSITLPVTGKAPNNWPLIGGIVAAIVIIGTIYGARKKKR